MHGQRWVWLIGVANTKAMIVALVATAVQCLTKPSLFLQFSIVLSPLQVARVTESPDQDVFMPITTVTTKTMTIDGQTDYFIPCACMWGN